MKALIYAKIFVILFTVIISYAFVNSPDDIIPPSEETYLTCPVIPYIYPNTCQSNDSLALVAIYNATNGAGWINRWDLTQPVSTWHGVKLNNTGCVTTLRLQNNQLSGSLPPEIGNLSQLSWIWISDNQLTGSIPPEIGNLTNMEWLWLFNNELSGNIPPEINNLTNLEWLWLTDNQLTGNIPPLNNLVYLKWFWIANNQLSGCYDNSLVNLCTQLDPIFSINAYMSDGNNFDDSWENFCSTQAGICMPISCGQTDSLALVELYHATNGASWSNTWDLTQTISTWYGVTTNANGCVIALQLPDNQLNGHLPAALSDLEYLTWLWVSGNQLSGCYPLELQSLCSQLAPAYNDNSYISEGNNFETTWEDFCNNNNGICDICQPRDSLALVAFYNATDGANWTSPWNLKQPITTWMGVTSTQDGCVTELKLSNSQVIGNLPPEIGNLNSLTELNLGSNQLSGTIPLEIGNLAELTFLNLGDNQFSGNIPIEITNLTNLTILGLETNQLNGTIPPEIGNLTELTWLWLSENQLTGNIPPELGNLNNINFLWMEDNQLTGNIPPEISNIENLVWLWLSGNQLSGCYDIALAELCSQLDPTYNTNTYISNGNNFSADWEMFCNNQEGFCGGPVWPGDFNSDGRAKHTDLLYLGLAYGNTGSPRPNATTDWTPQNAPEWQSTVSGVNSKHQDGNGDGVVNSLDIDVLINNYDRVHSFTFPNYLTTTLEYRLEARPSTVESGNLTLNYALYVEELDAAALAHGLAFEIDFTSLPLTHASADFSNSSLQPDEYINFYYTQTNTLKVVLTRTDLIDQICNTPVALIQAILPLTDVPEDIFLIRLPNEEGLMQADGTRKVVRGMTLHDKHETTNDLTLTASTRQMECMSGGEATVHISGGTAPYDIQWNTGADTPHISGLTPNIYTVAVSDATGVSDTLSVEIDGLFIPIYDNFGNLVECNTYTQCATVSNFTDIELPEGTQAAGAAISTNGTVPAGSQVTLKAGNVIILEANFEVHPNADFSAEIEDCQ